MTPAKLKPCDLAVCEGMCCHDGAWLEPEEARALRRLVFRRRADLPGLPDRFLEAVDGAHKTATRPHAYRSPEFPAHFPRTRCVFCLPDARCALQVLAEGDGLDRWAYKPRACWLHPLRENAERLLPPPALAAEDWDRTTTYPGYVVFTECGRNRDDGAAWTEVLSEECARWRPRR